MANKAGNKKKQIQVELIEAKQLAPMDPNGSLIPRFARLGLALALIGSPKLFFFARTDRPSLGKSDPFVQVTIGMLWSPGTWFSVLQQARTR